MATVLLAALAVIHAAPTPQLFGNLFGRQSKLITDVLSDCLISFYILLVYRIFRPGTRFVDVAHQLQIFIFFILIICNFTFRFSFTRDGCRSGTSKWWHFCQCARASPNDPHWSVWRKDHFSGIYFVGRWNPRIRRFVPLNQSSNSFHLK